MTDQKTTLKRLKKTKISFVSAIIITIGSSVGSGFFFKSGQVLQNAGFAFPLAIFAWLISSLAVIAMAVALIEVTKQIQKNDLSIIEWAKNYNRKWVYKALKNFLYYIYFPALFFAVPLYAFNSLQSTLAGFGANNNFNTPVDFIIWMVIGFGCVSYFVLTSGISTKWFNIQNWVLTLTKFLPLLLVLALSILVISDEASLANQIILTPQPVATNELVDFAQLSPGVGLFISFAAIYFAFDGFYFTSGVQTEMKNPNKTSYAILIGIGITSLIYLTLAIVLALAAPHSGRFSDLLTTLNNKNIGWLFGVVNLLIFIGVLGIMNIFCMYGTRITHMLLLSGWLPGFAWLQKPLHQKGKIISACYLLVVILLVDLVFGAIGGFGYFVPSAYLTPDTNLSAVDGFSFFSMAKVLGFADLVTNWISVGVFVFILVILFGFYRQKQGLGWQWKISIFLAFVLIGLGLVFQTLSPFANLIIYFVTPNLQTQPNELTARILVIIVLFLYFVLLFAPNYFDYDAKRFKQKYCHIYDPVVNLQRISTPSIR